MSKTKINHFFSEHIIRNFKEKNKPLFILNCKTKNIIPKSSAKAFSNRRLWSQELEDSFRNIEDKLSRYIQTLRSLPIDMKHNKIFYYEIDDNFEKVVFNKFLFQPMLLQIKNKSLKEEPVFSEIFDYNFDKPLPVYYLRYNKTYLKKNNDQFILTDVININMAQNNIFLSYAISPYELIVYGEPIKKFLEKYSIPFIYNIFSISNNRKECEILSANKDYLEKIKQCLQYIPISNITIER